MRIGLLAALRRSEDRTLRAALPLAGRSVLAWQAAVLQAFGAERVLCLTEAAGPDIIAVQHQIESGGAAFHALSAFAALPALVRAEDDLIILADGLVPDPGVLAALLGTGAGLRRMVLTIPADHPFAAAHPADFERIEAGQHWAGVLVMRGGPVQQLADFPGDADAVSVLLRLALQAGTPRRDWALADGAPDRWLLAESAGAVAAAEQALIARAAAAAPGRGPLAALAARLVRALAPRGLAQGAVAAAAAALVLLLSGIIAAAFGSAAAGLALAGLGAFAAEIAGSYAALAARLRGAAEGDGRARGLGMAVDALAAVALWFALAPWPAWQPLAVLGPVTVGLARLSDGSPAAAAAVAAERASLLLALALAAALGWMPEMLACLALGLVAALLLRARPT